MVFSEKYTTLVAALVAARLQYGSVLKQKSNTHFGGKYADLAAVMEAVDDALAAAGVYPMQSVVKVEGEPLQLQTRLMHTSGEYVVSHYPLSIKDGNPQSVGSAVTYARRYSLMALLGIAPEDDDGEAAAGRGQKGDPPRERQRATKADEARPKTAPGATPKSQAAQEPAAVKPPAPEEPDNRPLPPDVAAWDVWWSYDVSRGEDPDELTKLVPKHARNRAEKLARFLAKLCDRNGQAFSRAQLLDAAEAAAEGLPTSQVSEMLGRLEVNAWDDLNDLRLAGFIAALLREREETKAKG